MRKNLESVVILYRAPISFEALQDAGRADGRYPKMLRALSRADLLILDDWGPESLNADQRRDLLEIVEDRYNRGAVLITTQVPIGRW